MTDNAKFRAAKAQLAYKGVVLKVDDGEYNVGLNDGSGKYYTNDLDDAIATGTMMSEVEFINDEDKWPAWPKLPVKRGKGNEQLGVLIKGGPERFVVYLTNMFQPITDETQTIEYTSANAVVADKWRVD